MGPGGEGPSRSPPPGFSSHVNGSRSASQAGSHWSMVFGRVWTSVTTVGKGPHQCHSPATDYLDVSKKTCPEGGGGCGSLLPDTSQAPVKRGGEGGTQNPVHPTNPLKVTTILIDKTTAYVKEY